MTPDNTKFRPAIPRTRRSEGLLDAANSLNLRIIDCISKGTIVMLWLRWISVALLLGVGGVALADDVIYQYEGDVPPYDPSEGWLVNNSGCEPPCTEGNADGKFFLFWPTPGDRAGYTYFISEPPDSPPLRCGSSGDFAPTTHWGRCSSAAMRISTSSISTWWTGSISTVTRSSPAKGVILLRVST